MSETAQRLAAQLEDARSRIRGIPAEGQLPPGIDPDYYDTRKIPNASRPRQQGCVVDLKAHVTSEGGADYD